MGTRRETSCRRLVTGSPHTPLASPLTDPGTGPSVSRPPGRTYASPTSTAPLLPKPCKHKPPSTNRTSAHDGRYQTVTAVVPDSLLTVVSTSSTDRCSTYP